MYKFGQGMASRVGAFITILLIGFYAGIKWYYYAGLWANTFGTATTAVGVVGALVFLVAFALVGLKVAFYSPRSSDFLIDMDAELRKVVWPALQPLFEPKTEAWGHTYVVIISTIVFTTLIYIIDILLYYGVDRLLFNTILFPSA